MRVPSIIVATVAVAWAIAAPAQAAQGTGLYEPFPSPTGGVRAQRYVGDFGVRVAPGELRAGVTLPGSEEPLVPADRSPGHRAGIVGQGASPGLWVGALLALVVIVAVVGRRRVRVE
jgi:hypothetical protein